MVTKDLVEYVELKHKGKKFQQVANFLELTDTVPYKGMHIHYTINPTKETLKFGINEHIILIKYGELSFKEVSDKIYMHCVNLDLPFEYVRDLVNI